MDILTLNPGSSSLKAALFETPASGEDLHCRQRLSRPDLNLRQLLQDLHAGTPALDAVGIRIVNGGPDLRHTTRLTAETLQLLETACDRAPIHNAPALKLLQELQTLLEEQPSPPPVFLIVDTELFETLPEVESTLAIPQETAQEQGLRREGFHGLAHASMLQSWFSRPNSFLHANIVSLQLGGGCSVASFRGRQPMTQSMGFSPLSGIVMSTRSGDIDPALPLYLARHSKRSPDEIDTWLNTECGLKGLSGISGDMSEVMQGLRDGSRRARLAVDVFCHRARQQVLAACACLGPPDVLLFGGGIGENAAYIRSAICEPLDWIGVILDPRRNADDEASAPARISSDASRVDVYRCAVDEETLLAEQVCHALDELEGTSDPNTSADKET